MDYKANWITSCMSNARDCILICERCRTVKRVEIVNGIGLYYKKTKWLIIGLQLMIVDGV